MVNVQANTSKNVPVDEVPHAQQFVYLKDGIETTDESEATERIPIVEVRMISVDERGALVPTDSATRLVIHELGPEGRALRHTTMVRGG